MRKIELKKKNRTKEKNSNSEEMNFRNEFNRIQKWKNKNQSQTKRMKT